MSHTPPPGVLIHDPEENAIPELIEDAKPWPDLTVREREVAELLVRGLKNAEIADALGISVKTVDTHRGHVLKKLGKRNNVELTRYAFRMGWTSTDESEDQS